MITYMEECYENLLINTSKAFGVPQIKCFTEGQYISYLYNDSIIRKEKQNIFKVTRKVLKCLENKQLPKLNIRHWFYCSTILIKEFNICTES